jgi:hypothetical protein
LEGPDPSIENLPSQVEYVLSQGIDVEIDVWYVEEQFWLGHDNPQYLVKEEFLLKEGLWCHAKNWQALEQLLRIGVHCFWHQEDDYTLTSKSIVWVYPRKFLFKDSVCVMPESTAFSLDEISKCMGVCTDFVFEYIEKFKNYGKTRLR